jgi:hypothetical protein
MPLTWTPDKFRKELLAAVADNAEAVGIFVEVKARNNLLAVKDPAWGAKYRSQIVARLLTHEVEVSSREVTIRIGTKISSEFKSKDYKHYGFYVEIGTRRFPAHPWLRPSIFSNGREIVRMLGGS